MSIKPYADIIINGSQFYIVERQRKFQNEGSALSTLNRIEEVMRRGLKYSSPSDENCSGSQGELWDRLEEVMSRESASIEQSYSKLSQVELWGRLKQKAASIRDSYMHKTAHVSFFRRFFGGISKKEKEIQKAFYRIKCLATPPPVFGLPDDLIKCISGFLETSDLRKLAEVNKHGGIHAEKEEVKRAREYGYKGRDQAEAKDFLKSLFKTIKTLIKDGHIPEEYVVRKGRRPFFRYVSPSATLEKIRGLSAEKQAVLKLHFSEVLLEFVKNKCLETVKGLLLMGANPNVKEGSHTSLHIAVREQNKELVALLLSQGADPNIESNHLAWTPINENINSYEIIDLLARNGANIDHQAREGSSALHKAVNLELIESVRSLLSHGANLNLRNNLGETPLMIAAGRKNTELVALLLDNGADPNIADNRGNTPVCQIIGSSEIVSLLAEKGAKLDHQDNRGNCAFHFAIWNTLTNPVNTVKALLEHKANPNLKNIWNTTPLDEALNKNIPQNNELIALLRHGMDHHQASHMLL